MNVERGQLIDDITRLQRCIDDLVGIVALPAMWSGAEPAQIVRSLLDVLPDMLRLDLLYVASLAPFAAPGVSRRVDGSGRDEQDLACPERHRGWSSS